MRSQFELYWKGRGSDPLDSIARCTPVLLLFLYTMTGVYIWGGERGNSLESLANFVDILRRPWKGRTKNVINIILPTKKSCESSQWTQADQNECCFWLFHNLSFKIDLALWSQYLLIIFLYFKVFSYLIEQYFSWNTSVAVCVNYVRWMVLKLLMMIQDKSNRCIISIEILIDFTRFTFRLINLGTMSSKITSHFPKE